MRTAIRFGFIPPVIKRPVLPRFTGSQPPSVFPSGFNQAGIAQAQPAELIRMLAELTTQNKLTWWVQPLVRNKFETAYQTNTRLEDGTLLHLLASNTHKPRVLSRQKLKIKLEDQSTLFETLIQKERKGKRENIFQTTKNPFGREELQIFGSLRYQRIKNQFHKLFNAIEQSFAP